jgi:hypothetical protein
MSIRFAFLSALLVLAPLASAADVSDPAPVFSAPTQITNAFAPFDTGSVKVFRGRVRGELVANVTTHLASTRAFWWNGQQVDCCVVEEQDFSDGVLEEISLVYVAQDDAGNVWTFGEISTNYAAGETLGVETDSWLVGGAVQVGDDPLIHDVEAPTLSMLVDPQVGNVFSVHPVEGGEPRLTVMSIGARVRVPAGKFHHALKLRALDDGEDSEDEGDDVLGGATLGSRQIHWFVPGLGLVKTRESPGRVELLATSLLEAVAEPAH